MRRCSAYKTGKSKRRNACSFTLATSAEAALLCGGGAEMPIGDRGNTKRLFDIWIYVSIREMGSCHFFSALLEMRDRIVPVPCSGLLAGWLVG